MDPLRVPGELSSLEPIRNFVREAAEEAGVGRKPAYQLALAIDEIATNIITHGYQEAGLAGDLVVSAEILGDALAVTVEDTAEAYDPRSYAGPDDEELHEPLGQRPIGGLGIYLALRGVDDLSWERVGGANRTRCVVARGTPDTRT